MKTAKKALLLALCAVLLVVATVMGTLAYLQSTTEVVKNTMTAGQVAITMDEAPVDNLGKETAGARVLANSYTLIPGKTYDKDPTIHVAATSEDAYIFVKVTNNIAGIESTIGTQMAAKGWVIVDGETDVYYNTVKYEKANPTADYVVIDTITIDGDVENAELDTYADKTVEFIGYAVQAEGFDTAVEAWDATFGA